MSLPNIPDEYGIRNCLCSGYAHPTPKRKCRKCGAEAECYGDDSGYLTVASGRLQLREWTDKNGNKRRSAEVVAEHVYFGESKGQHPTDTYGDTSYPPPNNGGYSSLEDADEGELPF